MEKQMVMLALMEMHKAYMRLHNMRKMFDESNEKERADVYVNRAIGMESAMTILRNSAGISLNEYIDTAAAVA
mgnify:CR=1 FL=1